MFIEDLGERHRARRFCSGEGTGMGGGMGSGDGSFIGGGESGGGSGPSMDMGSGGGMGGLGNIDLTFGQGKVYQGKLAQTMALLQTLLAHPAAAVAPRGGQSVGQAPVSTITPLQLVNLLHSFNPSNGRL